MSERQGFVIRNGFLATGALAIFVLLMLFYSTVSGAVDRAARHRADAASPVATPSQQSRKLASLSSARS